MFWLKVRRVVGSLHPWCCPRVCSLLSRVRLFGTFRDCSLKDRGILCPWDAPGMNTGVGCLALLQGVFHFWILLCCMTKEMLSALGFWNTLYPREPAYLKDTINKLRVSSWSWVTSAGVGSSEGIRRKVQKDPR